MSIREIRILSNYQTVPPAYKIDLIYSTGKKEQMNYIHVRDLIRLYKGNGIALPAQVAVYDKKIEYTCGNEVSGRNKQIDDETVLEITNVAKNSGRNNYCNATLTYKYGNKKNVTMAINELETVYNDNFLFIPDDVQKIFDQYYTKNSINAFVTDDVREKTFIL